MVDVCMVKFPDLGWLKKVVAIGKTSYYNESFFEILENLKDEEVEPFLSRIIELGHESVLEHITFTFLIFDVSRWTTHQLVRHRIASYTQKSLRKEREITKDSFVISDTFPDNLRGTANEFYDIVVDFYNNLIKRGVSVDDARSFLPGSIKTEIAWTVNLRSLRNFIKERYSVKAQSEIRMLAEKIISIFDTMNVSYLLKGVIEE